MKKNHTSTSKAQQKQSPVSNLVFNTVEGFAADGIVFDGNYKNESDRVLIKTIFFPGGTKLGLESIMTFFHEAALVTLMAQHKLCDSSELDHETKMYYFNLKCTCCHALYIAEMIEGKTHKEAVNNVLARLKEIHVPLTKKDLEDILNEDITKI